MYFLKHLGRVQKFFTIQKLLSKRWPKVTFEHIFWAITAREQVATNLFSTQNSISRLLISRYRKNISKPNSWENR